jgi:tRNA A-37 threonylcarbamoyl transferase component Bud32
LDTRLQLPVGTVLDGSYRIEGLLGFGGFGVTYAAEDFNLGTTVALKEYYPIEFGDRDATMSVRPKSERHKTTFEWGRSSFLQEARMLARFRHPSIVRVSRVFEAHSTAYMVMDFEQGQNFEQWLTALDRPPTQEELDRIVAPILDALELMHAQHFLHRDIAPDNIIVRPDGTPVLLDFGAARRAVAEMSRTLTGIVKAGYSPQEQYATDSRLQGPWSDLYAFGATLYRAVAGHPPEEASLRAGDDRTVPAAATKRGAYRPGFLTAIDACLKMRHAERPKSVAQLRPLMLGSGSQARVPALPATRVLHGALSKTGGAAMRNPMRRAIVIGASLALFGGAYLGFEYSRWQATDRSRIEAEAKRQVDAAAAAAKARVDVELRRQNEERSVQEKRLADERARQAAELKQLLDGRLAAQKAEEAKRQQDERAAAEKKAAEAGVRQDAEAKTAAARPISHIMYRRYDVGTLVTGNVRRMPTGEWLETNTRNSKWTFRATEERANELILYDASRNVYVKMDLVAKRMFVRQGAEGAWVSLADIVWTDK